MKFPKFAFKDFDGEEKEAKVAGLAEFVRAVVRYLAQPGVVQQKSSVGLPIVTCPSKGKLSALYLGRNPTLLEFASSLFSPFLFSLLPSWSLLLLDCYKNSQLH